ncbi:MAG: hypothetical protein RIT24_1899, partial [Planctomycetota bacterium]
ERRATRVEHVLRIAARHSDSTFYSPLSPLFSASTNRAPRVRGETSVREPLNPTKRVESREETERRATRVQHVLRIAARHSDSTLYLLLSPLFSASTNRAPRVRGALFVEAERVGFEPTSRMNPLLVFETSSFNRSDTSPGTEPVLDGLSGVGSIVQIGTLVHIFMCLFSPRNGAPARLSRRVRGG